MGHSNSTLMPNYDAIIRTSEGQEFKLSYRALVDHILLLRVVSTHSEMTQPGETLNYYVEDYCQRIANKKMMTKQQQQDLPWQIEWIWHIHRLHPLAYIKDCTEQLPNGKVLDKKCLRLRIGNDKKHHTDGLPKLKSTDSKLVPSFNLVDAVLRQHDFLENFKRHTFYTWDLRHMTGNRFRQLVQNYVSFLKLAVPGEIIVPTFDIDLIWHTHMRFPLFYQKFTISLCGFFLNHDDAIENNKLTQAYQKTADRWRQTYQVNYGTDIPININRLRESHYTSSCACIVITCGSSAASNCGGGTGYSEAGIYGGKCDESGDCGDEGEDGGGCVGDCGGDD